MLKTHVPAEMPARTHKRYEGQNFRGRYPGLGGEGGLQDHGKAWRVLQKGQLLPWPEVLYVVRNPKERVSFALGSWNPSLAGRPGLAPARQKMGGAKGRRGDSSSAARHHHANNKAIGWEGSVGLSFGRVRFENYAPWRLG